MRIDFEHAGQPVMLHGFDGDHISKVVERTGDFYELSMLEYAAALEPYGTVVDVGANIGNHTVFFGMFTPAERIVAIEPYSPAADLLERNIKANKIGDKVVQHTCAVGIANEGLQLIPGKFTNRGHTSVRKVWGYGEMTARPLSELVTDEEVSMVKIDVEGYELEVLVGALELITAQHPALFVEASSRRRQREIGGLLSSVGYYSGIRVSSGTKTFAYLPRNRDRKVIQ